MNCPKCGQVDMVQKVSAIYFAGVTTSSLSGPSVGGAVPIGEGQTSVGGGYTTLKGGSQSLLSNRLTPPPQPSAERKIDCAIICGVILFLLLLGGLLMQNLVVGFLFALIIAGVSIAYYVGYAERETKEVSVKIPQWEKAMVRWDALYFCARDDGVFDPNERVFIPTHQMMDYIYR